MDNQNMRKLFIVRRESLGIGGAEKVANRFINSFSEHFDAELIHAGKTINGFRIGGSVGPSGSNVSDLLLVQGHFLRNIQLHLCSVWKEGCKVRFTEQEMGSI